MSISVNPRSRARESAMQAIYSWLVSENNLADIELDFMSEQDLKGVDKKYFRELLSGVILSNAELDDRITPFLTDRSINELGYVEHAVLLVAAYELLKREDVPYKVVINEAINVAKLFGAEDSHKFVNGVLDKLAPTIRKR